MRTQKIDRHGERNNENAEVDRLVEVRYCVVVVVRRNRPCSENGGGPQRDSRNQCRDDAVIRRRQRGQFQSEARAAGEQPAQVSRRSAARQGVLRRRFPCSVQYCGFRGSPGSTASTFTFGYASVSVGEW